MQRDVRTGSQRGPERLAYWYFRLNGFMTIENFVVHPDTGNKQRTEVDILATRCEHRRENVERPMIDDARVAECPTFANIIIAEIKTGPSELNGPWTDPDEENMARVLRSIGCARQDEVVPAAQSLYEEGKWSNHIATVRLFVVGELTNADLPIGLEQQIEWASVIQFCVNRFRDYRRQKVSNGQWSPDGIRLRQLALRNDIESIRLYFALNTQGTPL